MIDVIGKTSIDLTTDLTCLDLRAKCTDRVPSANEFQTRFGFDLPNLLPKILIQLILRAEHLPGAFR